MRIITFCVVISMLLAVPSMAAEWPRFGGPNANLISPETGINKDWARKKPPVLWTLDLSDDGYSGPAVADGRMFIIDHVGANDVVRAVDVANGKQVWEVVYPEATAPDHGYTASTPTIDSGKVYTLGFGGVLNCLDFKDGKKIWSYSLKDDFGGQPPQWLYAMSMPIDGDKLIVCPGGQTGVVALNKNTGNVIWKGGNSDNTGYATPVFATLAGKRQYVISTGPSIVGVDSDDGKVLWTFPWKNRCEVNAAMPIQIGDDSVFITSGYGLGCGSVKIDGDKATAVYHNKEMQSHFNTPVLIDGMIYGTTDPGDLICLDPKTGKTLWRKNGFEKGGCVVVDGVLIAVTGNTGDVVMVELTPDAYKEICRVNFLGGQHWPPPVVAEGKLFIRNTKKLACIDLK